jgi:hypothetical protein
MPGSFTSQGYNPTTGQSSPMTGGQSNAGNMAYNAIDSRPSPVTASATGLGGNAMPFQDSLTQREAFVGNLSQRLGQYSGGQLSGPVTFDPSQLMSQANDQLANGTFYNPFSTPVQYGAGGLQGPPAGAHHLGFGFDDADGRPINSPPFSQQNPEVQQAMGNSNQYMQGNFQNPFGQQANVQQPSFGQQSYNPNNPSGLPQPSDPNWLGGSLMQSPQGPAQPSGPRAAPSDGGRDLGNDIYMGARLRPDGNRGLPPSNPRAAPNVPSSPAPQGGGQTYQPNYAPPPMPERRAAPNVPNVPSSPAPSPSGGQQPQATTQAEFDRLNNRTAPYAAPSTAVPQHNPVTVNFTPEQQASIQADMQAYNQRRADRASAVRADAATGQARPVPPPSQGTPYNPQAQAQGLPDIPQNTSPPPASTDAQLAKIDSEINKWQRATYGTRTGGGPPAEWQSHIQALQRLRNRAKAGDPAALAWSPKMKAPPPNVTPTVPVNRRGSAARFGGMRQNGDNRR